MSTDGVPGVVVDGVRDAVVLGTEAEFADPLYTDADSDASANAMAGIAAFGLVWTLVCLVLLMLIPLVNIIILCIFAFSEWPIQKELREARARGGGRSSFTSGLPEWLLRVDRKWRFHKVLTSAIVTSHDEDRRVRSQQSRRTA